jgi:2'-5' RNA ligase|tara:strand:+ start:367 stop:933 length:567 start_codon:yes stop_codon:yes gene_type:complete
MGSIDKRLAVVIELQGQLERSAREVWKKLAEEISVKYVSSSSPAPHIALEYGFKAQYDRLVKLLDNISTQFSVFSINGMGLGVYVYDAPNVHIRWRMNNNLLNLKNTLRTELSRANEQGVIAEYEEDESWQAKTTLAQKDTSCDNLSQILGLARPYDFSQETIINGFSLYEYSDEEGERKLDFFQFGS